LTRKLELPILRSCLARMPSQNAWGRARDANAVSLACTTEGHFLRCALTAEAFVARAPSAEWSVFSAEQRHSSSSQPSSAASRAIINGSMTTRTSTHASSAEASLRARSLTSRTAVRTVQMPVGEKRGDKTAQVAVATAESFSACDRSTKTKTFSAQGLEPFRQRRVAMPSRKQSYSFMHLCGVCKGLTDSDRQFCKELRSGLPHKNANAIAFAAASCFGTAKTSCVHLPVGQNPAGSIKEQARAERKQAARTQPDARLRGFRTILRSQKSLSYRETEAYACCVVLLPPAVIGGSHQRLVTSSP
jgi:hypothetical protein